MFRKPALYVALLYLVTVFCAVLAAAPAAVDPVTTFIVEADSAARAGGDEALADYVGAHPVLVGAAVGQLLDVAFDIGEGGDRAAEAENVGFAERVARVLKEGGGSDVPLKLVRIYRGWSPELRATRATIKSLEAEGFAARDAGEYDRAVEIFGRVVEKCGEIDDRRTEAVTWGSLGVVHWYRGDMEMVERSYVLALAARRAIEDRILEGRTLNGLGSVNLRTGNYQKAVQYYDQAAALRRKTGDLGGLGTSLTYRGNAWYFMNRLVEARESYAEAYEILERLDQPAKMLEVLNSIGSIYHDMGSLSRSNEYYLRAIDVAASANQPHDEAECRINLAGNYREQGRFNDALRQLEAARPLLDRVPDPVKTANYYCERGLTYTAMGEMDQAREDILNYVKTSETVDDPNLRAEALIELGYLYRELGACERGLDVVEQACELTKETGNDRMQRSVCVLGAVMYQSLGRIDEALEQRERALEIDRVAEAGSFIIEDQLAIASLKALLGQTAGARADFYRLEPGVRDLGRSELQWVVAFGIGHTFEKENPDSAAWHYERGLAMVEASRSAVGGAETRSGFLSGERRYFYEEVARYYASMGERTGDDEWYERAFGVMERAKARGLLDLMERPALAEVAPAEQALLDSLYQVTGDTPGEAGLRRRLEERYVALREARMQEQFGALECTHVVERFDEVRKALPRGTAMLEYALGDSLSLLWVIDRKGFDCYTVPARGELAPKVVQLRDALMQPGAGDAVVRRVARDLYLSLVAPAEDGRLRKAKRLVIVPDGVLFEVPFEVLLTAEPDGDNATGWGELPYLARSFQTCYVPSASILVKMRGRDQHKYDLELLAMGDPDYSLLDCAPDAALAALPYTRAEVEQISSLVKKNKCCVFLGSDASEAALKRSLADGTPRVLHLATHGVVDPYDPVSSSVVLSPDSVSGDDGYVYTLEILPMQMDVGLVVLSACESARGRVQRGEGVVGLSRAFMASGAGGVVASLWAVSDESTAELMTAFYGDMLGEKHSASEALAVARLELLEHPDYAHPFYWSPFVVIGSGGNEPW